MQHITIKEITAEQLTTYKAFLMNGLIDDEDNFRISPNDERDAPFPTKGTIDSFTIGAYNGDALAGMVSFERDGATREKLRHKGTMIRMYVSPQQRGKGIAKQLIIELIDRVKSIGNIEQINLTVIENNATAIKLYEQFGFVIFSREEHAMKWKGQYFTELQMVLRFDR
jgi:ribosomal protein S18 acetylase RimI-like enzyme